MVLSQHFPGGIEENHCRDIQNETIHDLGVHDEAVGMCN
jgi:hypothetical protein